MKRVGKYDEERCRGWRDDIDTLLVFAGLFSSVVTAFTIESYKWLQQDPINIQTALLSQIVRRLSEPGNQNVTESLMTGAPFSPSASSVRINVFWFLSLTLSLSTVLIGILCKQWLREYQRDAALSQQQSLELRQMRYESLGKWGVPGILASLPLFLQVSLVLFFSGILDLLWSYNTVVASFVTCIVGLGLLIVGVTTILPTYYILSLSRDKQQSHDIFPCPYKSPQSWLFHRLTLSILQLPLRGFRRHPAHYSDWVSCDIHLLRTYRYLNLYDPDAYLARGMRWIITTLGDSVTMAKHVFHCLQSCPVRVVAYAIQQDMETATRDSVNLRFVEEHWGDGADADLEMRNFSIELILRTLNTRSSPAVGASGTLKKLALLVNANDGVEPSNDLWLQTIVSIRHYVTEDRASVDDILSLLEIFECCWHTQSSTSTTIPSSSQDMLRDHAIHFLNDFEHWLDHAFHSDLRRARISETASALIRIIYYMVHYFNFSSHPSSNLLSSERFASFVKTVDEQMIDMEIEAECLPGVGGRIGRRAMGSLRFSWQEAKNAVSRRSELPPDYFRIEPLYSVREADSEDGSESVSDSQEGGHDIKVEGRDGAVESIIDSSETQKTRTNES
ncbi:hypothetical protein K435DRAFT_526775 [Dendrothele bispora CBS 962.96]|uniref:DUF6535 domain-containing protein n=1 Tax=Dendrothele bispora (strain CBS 962.96) TaxID=1314807 RepID=A0A4V4HGF5_DENBC|nr:hypothetical protein K435DRAFT_526775 [Dendrothele bispora CBS 962.96]